MTDLVFLQKFNMRYQDFTSSGNFTMPTTPGIWPLVIIRACGGGGGGGGSWGAYGAHGGGGAGAAVIVATAHCVPGSVYAVVIGAGGTGGTAQNTLVAGPPISGSAGGTTTFIGTGVDLRFLGGLGGGRGVPHALPLVTAYNPYAHALYQSGYALGGRPRIGGTRGGGLWVEAAMQDNSDVTSEALPDGEPSAYAAGGGAYGGGAAIGAGAALGTSAAANSGAGGGGGNHTLSTNGGNTTGTGGGGSGGSGILRVYYFLA